MKKIKILIAFSASIFLMPGFLFAQSDVLVNTFGSGDSYIDGSGWTLGYSQSAGGSYVQAIGFIPEGTGNITQYQIAVFRNTGGNTLNAWLLSDNDNYPGDIIEAFSFNVPAGTNDLMLFANSPSNPFLAKGTQYWLVVAPPDLENELFGWYRNDPIDGIYNAQSSSGPFGPWNYAILGERAPTLKITGNSQSGSFIDSRDSHVYDWVLIGNQVWMAENLAYLPEVFPITAQYSDDVPRRYVYGYEGTDVSAAMGTDNYNAYGVLYNWPAAVEGCPDGWHLSAKEEWQEVQDLLGIVEESINDYGGVKGLDGGVLKEIGTDHWNDPNSGANSEYGLNIRGAGIANGYLQQFSRLKLFTSFWQFNSNNATTYAGEFAIDFHYDQNDYYEYEENEHIGQSVRCVLDQVSPIPILTTTAASSITANSATSGGNVSDDGGETVTARGVCWNTLGNPTVQNNDGITTDGSGTGSFTSNIIELTPNTVYYVRAYATSSAGTAYGNQVTLETCPIITITSTLTYETCIGCDDGSADIEVQTGDSPFTYLWTGPEGYTSNLEDNDNMGAGDYTVTITDSRSCVGTANVRINNINPLVVTHTDDAGYGSLRNAINYANEQSGKDQIIFDIPNSPNLDPHIIQPVTVLPTITDPVDIDGYSDPEAVPATGSTAASLQIVIDGINLNTNGFASGLNIKTTECTVAGISIYNFGDAGIHIEEGGNHTITGNHIGVDEKGITSLANKDDGIRIFNSSDNTIGGDLPENRNIISGNGDIGIEIQGSNSTENRVMGNYIGTNASGTSGRGNTREGISINNGASDNFIGSGNLISGNGAFGITIYGITTSGNQVINNLIGTTTTGDVRLSNYDDGVNISESSDNIISGNVLCGAGRSPYTVGNNGIEILGANASGNIISDNFIGTNANNTQGLGNGFQGIQIKRDAHHNKIGPNNVISGNAGHGILIEGDTGWEGAESADHNEIFDNFIGTNNDGTDVLPNITCGIMIKDNAANNKVGPGNVIAGNIAQEIMIEGAGSSNNIVTGNFIGTNATGDAPLSYFNNTGILIAGAPDNVIGPGNIISGSQNRITIRNGEVVQVPESATGNVIKGNLIGTKASGLEPIDDAEVPFSGIEIHNATGNIIGGLQPQDRNIISGHEHGIILGMNGTYNTVIGNYIGTDKNGSTSIGNAHGIWIGDEASGNLIGGSSVDSANVISGNLQNGVSIVEESFANTVRGNFIGVKSNRTEYLGNQGCGVAIDGASNNSIVGNIIAGNSYHGVLVKQREDEDVINNLISKNSIYDNGGLGIELLSDGFTYNDYKDDLQDHDADQGPNNLQNFPVLESVEFTPDDVKVQGTLNSIEGQSFTIEFFANVLSDNNIYNDTETYGEGQTYLGSTTLITDGNGDATFTYTLPLEWYSGQVITSTATDGLGNTSEFSQSIGGAKDQIVATVEGTFEYWINEEDVSIIPYSLVENAILSAYQTWDNVQTADIQFDFVNKTADKYASASDGKNLISFKDDHFPFAPGVLAVTAKTLQMIPGTNEAAIIDADIIFNPMYRTNEPTPFDILEEGDSESESFDIQSVATHEIGHQLGMIHSGVYDAVMYFMLGYGTEGRHLKPDDIAWLSHRYQTENHQNSFNYITGNVTYGDEIVADNPDSHPPVAGALVLAAEAINSEEQNQIHAYTDVSGNYSIPIPVNGMATNEFWIHIQPLDGNVWGNPLTAANISPYVYAYTNYTDFPEEFYDEFEGASEVNPMAAVEINILDENERTGVNLITNIDETDPILETVRVKYDETFTDVSVNPTITAQFSEAVNLSSFDASTCFFELVGEMEAPDANYSYFGNSKEIVLISPNEALNYSSSYNIHFGAITDMKGNVLENQSATQFSTEEPDTEHPYVLDIIPQESQVSVTSTVRVFFNEPMDVASVENGFSLHDNNGSIVEGDPVWNTEGEVMEYIPDLSLLEDMTYNVIISAGILDKSGLDMENGVETEFTTVGSAKPTLLYLGPEDDPNGLIGISVETSILAEFTEPININTINYSTFSLVGPDGMGVEGSFDFFDENRSVVFWPDEPLQYGEEYTINLTAGIKDVSEPSQTFTGTTSEFHTASGDIDPTIEYLEPYFGVAGSEVTIGGAGFSQITLGNTVKFGEMEAAVLSASTDYLTVRVPYEVELDAYAVTVTVGAETSGSKDFIVVDPTDNPYFDEGVYSSTGSNTRSVAIPPDAAYAYATNWGTGTVTVLNMNVDPPAMVTNIEVGVAPADIDINPEGTRAYVTNFLSNTVSVINIDPDDVSDFHQVINTIPVGYHPYGIVVSSDRKVYVANNASEYVSVIDADPESGGFDHVIDNYKTSTVNRRVAVTPDAGLLLVTGLNGVNIIDTDPVSPRFGQAIATAVSGSGTRGVRVTPDAALAIATTDLGDILFIDIYQPPGFQFGSAIASVRTGSSPRNILISADAATVYITNPEDNSVSIYKLDYSIIPGYGTTFDPEYGLELVATISDIAAPFAIASDPELKYILVTHDTYEGGVTKFTIGSDPIKTLEELIQSVHRAIHYERVDKKIGFKLIQDLQATLERVEAEDYGPAIDQLDNFIKRVDRYVKLGSIPDDFGEEWIDAAFRIRDELVKYAQGNKDFKGATETNKVEITDNMSNQSFTTQITEDLLGKQDLILQQNRPNPFSHQTMIYFEVPSGYGDPIPIMMRVYNTNGQVVKNLVNMEMNPGRYSVLWNGEMDDGGKVPEGLYLLELRTTDQRKVITLSVIK